MAHNHTQYCHQFIVDTHPFHPSISTPLQELDYVRIKGPYWDRVEKITKIGKGKGTWAFTEKYKFNVNTGERIPKVTKDANTYFFYRPNPPSKYKARMRTIKV